VKDLPNSEFYDAKYFEDGIASGKSCYVNYRWIPELTIPMAFWIVRALGIEPGARVLDYGCSKGYVVRALRLLGVDAWGVDVSQYAIRHCDADVRDYYALITDDDPVPVSCRKNVLAPRIPGVLYRLGGAPARLARHQDGTHRRPARRHHGILL